MARAFIVSLAALALFASCGKHEEPQSAPPPAAAPQTQTAAPSGPRVGDCIETTIKEVGSRLEGVPDSGSAIIYDNGVSQVSYDPIPGVDHSKAGDPVRLCLARLPQHCPPGDERGKIYDATNLRTRETWSASDSEHSCGGA